MPDSRTRTADLGADAEPLELGPTGMNLCQLDVTEPHS